MRGANVTPPRRPHLRRAILACAVAMSLPACSGVVLGNLGVLAVTLGIFVGTLSLGRAATRDRLPTDRSNP